MDAAVNASKLQVVTRYHPWRVDMGQGRPRLPALTSVPNMAWAKVRLAMHTPLQQETAISTSFLCPTLRNRYPISSSTLACSLKRRFL